MLNKLTKSIILGTVLLFLSANKTALANEVAIAAADFRQNENKQWTVNVTLKHTDTGWEHYADGWRIIDAEGNILGSRTLHHPHVNEQPFTRSLSNVVISIQTKTLYIEAHDKVHGWSKTRLLVNLNNVDNGRLHITAR